MDQPTVDNGGVSRGRSVAAAVGCWLLALQRHFNGTSMALQWQHFGASIRIGRESQCLPYAGFFQCNIFHVLKLSQKDLIAKVLSFVRCTQYIKMLQVMIMLHNPGLIEYP